MVDFLKWLPNEMLMMYRDGEISEQEILDTIHEMMNAERDDI